MMKKVFWIVGFILSGTGAVLASALTMPPVFSDHMVLQQGKPVVVWGTAPAKSTVTVEFADQKKSATADLSNHWNLTLDPMPASSKPRKMTVSSTLNSELRTLNFDDVLVGEVWLCGGQSNMAWPLKSTSHASESAPLFNGSDSIRFFNAPTPRTHLEQSGWDAWRVADEQTASQFSAVASLFGLNLSKALQTPVGIIGCSYGGSTMESWTGREALAGEPAAALILQADDAFEKAYSGEALAAAEAEFLRYQKTRAGKEPLGPWCQRRPVLMFENGLKPLIPYTVAGFLYYQGEAQNGRGAQVRKLLPLLIRDWRSHWNDPQLPFIVVQLPAFGVNGRPADVGWAEVRESQRLTAMETEQCALVVLIDSGEKDDVHPRYKMHVGERAARAALALAYGKPIPFAGPVYKAKTHHPDGSVTLKFDAGAGRLISQSGRVETGVSPVADGTAAGFTACGGDGDFVPAVATLSGVDEVRVRREDGGRIEHVRYAWKNWPEAGLYNDAGLPASPFRTDSLPLQSESNLHGAAQIFKRFLENDH
jgi:sialate O-acetylesterase